MRQRLQGVVGGMFALLLAGFPGVASADNLDVQGAVLADELIRIDAGSTRTLDFAKGGSSLYDNGDLHVKTDDLLYLDSPTVSVGGRLDVSKDLYAHYPIYAMGNLIQFGGNATATLDFNRGQSKVYDNGNLTLKTDDNLVVDATTLAVNKDLNVARNSRLQGNVTLAQTGGTAVKPNMKVDGYALFDGTVDFSGATTIGLASGSSSTGDFAVGTDLTVNSGARVGTGSTPDDITALADDTLFIEGASEFDGALYVDGAVDLDSTLNVAGASTLTGAVTSATNVTANLGGAEKFIISADSAPTDDMLTVTNAGFARTGTSGSAIQVNFVQGEITGTNTHSAVLISASTTSTDDTLYGLEIDTMSGTAGTQTAFMIDSGWDTDIEFVDSTAAMMLANGGSLTVKDSANNALMKISDSGVAANITPDQTGTGQLGTNMVTWASLYLGDNTGINLGLDQDALLAYDQLTDARTELTGTGASLWIEDRLSLGTQALTITDDGVANDSVTPTASVVVATVDATANVGTPNLTIAEASAKAGDILVVISATGSGDSFTINDEAGVTNGTAASLGADDTATFMYTGTIWTQLATSNN